MQSPKFSVLSKVKVDEYNFGKVIGVNAIGNDTTGFLFTYIIELDSTIQTYLGVQYAVVRYENQLEGIE